MRARFALLVIAFLLASCGGTPAATGSSGPATASTAAASATPSKAPDHIVVTYGSVAGDVLPTYVALEDGIFKKNGLDVELQLINSSSAAVAAVLAGKAQFSQVGGSEVLSADVAGADLEVVAMTSPTYSYVLEASKDIKTPAQLKGKKVGISKAGSSSDVAVRVALKKVGIDPDTDVSIVPVGGVPERTAAMEGGSIQATVANPPETTALERLGFTPLLDLASLKLPAALQGTVTKRDYATANKDVVQRYVDSIVESIDYIKKNKQAAVDVLKKYEKSDDTQAMTDTVNFYVNEIWPALPVPSTSLFADTVPTLAKKNPGVTSFDLTKCVDPTFVKSAGDRGLENQ